MSRLIGEGMNLQRDFNISSAGTVDSGATRDSSWRAGRSRGWVGAGVHLARDSYDSGRNRLGELRQGARGALEKAALPVYVGALGAALFATTRPAIFGGKKETVVMGSVVKGTEPGAIGRFFGMRPTVNVTVTDLDRKGEQVGDSRHHTGKGDVENVVGKYTGGKGNVVVSNDGTRGAGTMTTGGRAKEWIQRFVE